MMGEQVEKIATQMIEKNRKKGNIDEERRIEKEEKKEKKREKQRFFKIFLLIY